MVDIDKLFKKAEELGATDARIRITKTTAKSVSSVSGRIHQSNVVTSYNIGVFVSVGKRIGGVSATVNELVNLEDLIAKAVKIAKNSPEDKDWPGVARGLSKAKVTGVYDEKTAGMSIEEIAEIVMTSNELITSHDKRLKPISVGMSVNVAEDIIANSYGESVSTRTTSLTFGVNVRSKDGDKEGSYGEYRLYRRLVDLNFEDLTKMASKRALDALEARQISTGSYDIIFEGLLFSRILEVMLGPAISAYNVQMNRSPLKGKLDSEIAAEHVNFVEKPHEPWYPGTKEFDSEGIATKTFPIVEKGVLKSYIYDFYTASKEGKESTGNASGGLGQRTVPAPNNITLLPGDANEEEIIEETKHGVLVCTSIGYWLSNYISGQLNGTISHGYLIENGEISHAIKGVAFSDNFYEILKSKLDLIGKTLVPSARMASPMVRIKSSTIAGL
ncbi:MAG: TldD/PmbA family protein [Euryarchaeota archaeon]|nr:TldD/PmbA family protein [Euryarchaeota archaeon]